MPTPLQYVSWAGQSIWSDQISRRMLDSGELADRMERDAVTGVTSNPTIFANAIGSGDDYSGAIRELASGGAAVDEIYRELVARDIRDACDVLAPVYESTDGRDGFVSVEVSPTLAADTDGTVAEAREWVKLIDRPNLLVKVPATAEGIPAIRTLIGEGISINVTLIFAIERYRAVMEAYLSGLEDYVASGGSPTHVASVASFFVSRFDTEADKRLEKIGSGEALALRGKTAVANARVAYGAFLSTFRGPRWQKLVAQGARVQRPLWASTSTKNDAYSDIMYVTDLVAPFTVNTMPLKTMDAYQDHGPQPATIFGLEEVAAAEITLKKLEAAGVSYDSVVQRLETEGVEKFVASFDELRGTIEAAVGSH